MIRPDIQELLDEAKKSILEVKQAQTVSKVKVKNILENLRSALEYCAQFINQSLPNPKSGNIFFPYGEDETTFKGSVNKNFPQLVSTSPSLYNLLETLQPHRCGDDWLVVMCKATNEAKHKKSLDISTNLQTDSRVTAVSIPGVINFRGNGLRMSNNWVNGRRIDDFELTNGKLNTTFRGSVSPNLEFEIIENKIFVLDNYQCDLVELLEKSYRNISSFAEELFKP